MWQVVLTQLLTVGSIKMSTATTLLPGNAVGVRVEPIDAGIVQHLAQRYWDWCRLYDADASACPLQHPDVVLTDLEHGPKSTLLPALVSSAEGTGCHGIGALVPKVVQTRRLGAVPIGSRLQGYRLAGNGFVGESTGGDAVTKLLQQSLHHVRSSGSAFLLIEDLDDATPLAGALAATLPRGWSLFRHAGLQPRRRIQLPQTPEEYWQKFSSKTRQTFRRKLKKFGETRLERIAEVVDVPRFLEAAHAISVHTWQTRQFGLRIRNDAAELAQFTKLAELGLLRCYLWHVDNRPVAFTVGNQDHGCFHYEEVGYLAEFAKFSPGQMMLIQMIDDLITHNHADWFDFGGGDADYKELFANHTSRSGTVWLFPPTLSGRLTAAHLRLCLAGRQWTRAMIQRWGWTTRFRQWIRYGAKTSKPTNDSPPEQTNSARLRFCDSNRNQS